MKTTATITALTIALATAAAAESRIDTLCGAGHANEAAGPGDIRANPDGYYIRSLRTQLSHGDPRIVRATGRVFHLCTRSAVTPDMDATRALQLKGERAVKYLFVPVADRLPAPAS